MAENKKSFILYADMIHTVRKMPKDKVADLFITILEYVNDNNPAVSDLVVDLVFEPIKQQLKRDLIKWDKFNKKQIENGKLGGRPRKEITQINPNNPSLIPESQKSLNVNVTVNDSVNANETIIGGFKIGEDMIVLEMIKVWKKYNPAYLEDKESDYTACLQMAYKIARIKGWKEGDVINFRELDAVMSWGKIMAFVSIDAFLKNLPLKSLNNNFQMVVQKMQGQQSDAKKDEIKKPPQLKMTEAQKQKAMEEWANS